MAIKSGHGVGKSAFLSIIILYFLLTHYPCKIPCTANSQSQLYDVLWAELAAWHRCLRPEFRRMIKIRSDYAELVADPKNSFAVARTARREQPEALQGFHSPNLVFVIDEAAGVVDIIFEVAKGSMSTEGAYTIMASNPTRASGYFYNAFHKLKHLWSTMTVASTDSSRVSPAYPEEVAAEFGLQSNQYRVRVLGEFPTEDEDVLIPRHLCEAAIGRDVTASGAEIWGVDVARFGDDRSTLCKRRGNVVIEPVKAWQKKDGHQLAALIHAEYLLATVKPAEICIDVIGIGASCYDALMYEHDDIDCSIRAVNVAERPPTDDKYARLRDELWFRMKDWFSGMGCKIPDDRELIEEISEMRYDFHRGTQKMVVESKDSLRSRGLRSPDKAEALLMTFASPVTHKAPSRMWSKKGPLEPDLSGVM